MGCMAVSDPIAEHFKSNVFWGGLTYNAHCLGLATAEAVIDVMQEEGLVENSAKMGAIMRGHMERMKAKHPSVRSFRQIGLFGMMDLQRNLEGTRMAPYNGTSEPMGKLGAHFRQNHLFTFVRWGSFMCNPPLCITEGQLSDAFEIIDRGLDLTDAAMD